jgi:hypothetical protein
MILFSDQGAGFGVYRTVTDPSKLSDRSFSVERLGLIAHGISDHWEVFWENDPVHYRTFYSDLRNDEKRAIIRLLDRLNGVDRKESDNLRRWHEIMGLEPPITIPDIIVDDYHADNPWSDTVAKIEAARATDNTLA